MSYSGESLLIFELNILTNILFPLVFLQKPRPPIYGCAANMQTGRDGFTEPAHLLKTAILTTLLLLLLASKQEHILAVENMLNIQII